MELPNKKVKAGRINPKKIVIFSQPKVGKTTLLSHLSNSLLIDLEDGSEFIDAVKINVIAEMNKINSTSEKKVNLLDTIKIMIGTINKANNSKKGYVYKYGIIDTVTALEDIALILAAQLYKNTPMGRTWLGTDVSKLPNGAGYGYWREALSILINQFEQLFDTLVIVGHIKDKLVEKEGKEMTSRGLALTGKTSSILCSQVDAVGYMYRDKNETIINFSASESLLVGSRCDHLKGKEIVVGSSDENDVLTIDWSKVFLD